MYRRRRRNQGTWLPVIGQIPASGDRQSQFTLTLTIPTTGGNASILGIIPVTYDAPQENLLDPAFETLGEILSTEYFLKRIVGKCNVAVSENATGLTQMAFMPVYYIATAGFFIARARDIDAGGDELPIGGLNLNQYGPQMVETIREPWIWRRSWVLGGPTRQAINQAGAAGASAVVQFGESSRPPSNAGYGSIQDGPHVDAKTKRRVRQDERLWFAIQARSNGTIPSGASATLNVVGDFRYFAALRKPKNSGNF